MLGVAIDDRLTLLRRVVLGVVDLHACDVLGHDPPLLPIITLTGSEIP
jgi:hypothetical protein